MKEAESAKCYNVENKITYHEMKNNKCANCM